MPKYLSDEWNADDEALWAWDIEPTDPILASLHVEHVSYVVGDEDQDIHAIDIADALRDASTRYTAATPGSPVWERALADILALTGATLALVR